MKYRPLGKTGLDVSALSFGAAALGSVYGSFDEADGIRAVHAALDLGINYVDVSPYYGLTTAETVLGKALSQVARDRYFISTKAGRYGIDQFDMTKARIIRSMEESLARLQLDYVDILLLHDIEFVPFSQVVNEGIPALIHLKEQGKIRYYGVSGLPLKIFEKTLAQVDLDVMLSYCHYSLNDTTLLQLLPLLKRKSVGVINASPLSMGLLTAKGAPDWHPATPEIRRICKDAAEHCVSKGTDLSQLALRFSLSNADIATTLFSSANPLNVEKNVRWIEEPTDPELLQEVLAILRPVADATWPSGLPEYL